MTHANVLNQDIHYPIAITDFPYNKNGGHPVVLHCETCNKIFLDLGILCTHFDRC